MESTIAAGRIATRPRKWNAFGSGAPSTNVAVSSGLAPRTTYTVESAGGLPTDGSEVTAANGSPRVPGSFVSSVDSSA